MGLNFDRFVLILPLIAEKKTTTTTMRVPAAAEWLSRRPLIYWPPDWMATIKGLPVFRWSHQSECRIFFSYFSVWKFMADGSLSVERQSGTSTLKKKTATTTAGALSIRPGHFDLIGSINRQIKKRWQWKWKKKHRSKPIGTLSNPMKHRKTSVKISPPHYNPAKPSKTQ